MAARVGGSFNENQRGYLQTLFACVNHPPSSSSSILQKVIYELQIARPIDIYNWTSYFLQEFTALLIFVLTTIKDVTIYVYSYLMRVQWKNFVLATGYLALLALAIFFDITSTFVILSIFTLIVTNLRKRGDGELSAYSVFNEGFVRLLGTTTAEDIDNNIRNNRA